VFASEDSDVIEFGEQFKGADRNRADVHRANMMRMHARHDLENYAHSVCNFCASTGATVPKGDKQAVARAVEDLVAMTEACESAIAWLESHESAEAEEYEARRKKLQAVTEPYLRALLMNTFCVCERVALQALLEDESRVLIRTNNATRLAASETGGRGVLGEAC